MDELHFPKMFYACISLSEILFPGKSEHVYPSWLIDVKWFPETFASFKWNGQSYHAEFSGLEGLKSYIACAKTFAREYENLPWLRKAACYFAVIQPFGEDVVALCEKLDLKKDKQEIIREAFHTLQTEHNMPTENALQEIKHMGHKGLEEGQGYLISLADSIEACLL